jgi:hypothetical protein
MSVWTALKDHPRLGSIATPRCGIEYLTKLREHRAELISAEPREGFRPGVQKMSPQFEPFFLRSHVYLNMDPGLIGNKMLLQPWHLPKVLVNRHRKSRGPWRLIAVPDYSGLVAYENFQGVWPTGDVPVEVIAAILNGRVANAYVAAKEGQRNRRLTTISELPIPVLSEPTVRQLTDLVSLYRVERAELQVNPSRRRVARCMELLEQIDSIVLNSYSLPPAVERELLGYFADEARPGLEALMNEHGLTTEGTIPLPVDEAYDEEAPSPSKNVEQADAAFQAGLSPLVAKLRSEHPELFDESGELRLDEALRLLARRVDGKKVLSRAELLALSGQTGVRAPDAT